MRRSVQRATGWAGLIAALAIVLAGADAAEAPRVPPGTAVATFAAGCFWCTEADFEKVPGVVEAVSGYTGGTVERPSYRQVSAGGTGHTEAVRVYYDPSRVAYEQLLDVYWRNVDFLDAGGQFCDRGDQYRPAIFYNDDEQKRLAEQSKAELAASGRFHQPIVIEIEKAGTFYPAEDYHQDYYKKNPVRYNFYRWNCGRDQRLAELRGPAS